MTSGTWSRARSVERAVVERRAVVLRPHGRAPCRGGRGRGTSRAPAPPAGAPRSCPAPTRARAPARARRRRRADQVEHPVDAVRAVHVDVPGRAEHDRVARRRAGPRVGGRVVPPVCLDLDEPPPQPSSSRVQPTRSGAAATASREETPRPARPYSAAMVDPASEQAVEAARWRDGLVQTLPAPTASTGSRRRSRGWPAPPTRRRCRSVTGRLRRRTSASCWCSPTRSAGTA